MNSQVRLGVVGLRAMGIQHLRYLMNGEVENLKVTAVCNRSPEPIEAFRQQYGDGVATFQDYRAMFASGLIDGVLIVTPHNTHPQIAMDAFAAGLHVLTEKPAGAYTGQVREMNEAAKKSGKVFAIMFQQRTQAVYRKVRELVQGGYLGEMRRVNWVVTDCYRSQSYYDSSAWRATWAGEGGGVLPNQVSHQLDVLQWICGMPETVSGFCQFGRYHAIEAEDDVTAYFTFPGRATGVFIASTGEAPGTNRLEIAGSKGKLVVENGELSFWQLTCDERDFTLENKIMWGVPEAWQCDVPVLPCASGHKVIAQNWVDAILHGAALIAPGAEGLNSLMISNAIQLSTWEDRRITLPFAEVEYEKALQAKIEEA